jgi:hypothetical protein
VDVVEATYYYPQIGLPNEVTGAWATTSNTLWYTICMLDKLLKKLAKVNTLFKLLLLITLCSTLLVVFLMISSVWRSITNKRPVFCLLDNNSSDNVLFSGKYFSIKYPSSYTLIEEHPAVKANYPSVLSSISLVNTRHNNSTINITVAINFDRLTLDRALGRGPYLEYMPGLLRSSITKTRIDGVDALMVDETAAGEGAPTSDLIAIKGGNIYQIISHPTSKELRNDLDAIICGFRFNK